MKSKSVFLFFIAIAIATATFSQTFSISDSTSVFKNQEGKILNKEEVDELLKTTFSLKKENVNGKQVITIIPSANDGMMKRNAMLERFKESLINKPLTNFSLPGFYYQVWDLKQLRGRVLVMNFWFTTCGPCIKEMPVLNELVAAYKNKNVIFLAPAPETPGQIKRFLKKKSFNYNIIPAAQKYIKMLQIENFPTHLVIDKNGIIRQVFIGYSGDIKEKIQVEIEKLLKERW